MTDIHRNRAAEIFGVEEALVTKTMRDYAKLRSHAEAYGATREALQLVAPGYSLADVDMSAIEKRIVNQGD